MTAPDTKDNRTTLSSDDKPSRVVIIVPTLNEAAHIIPVLRSLEPGARRLGAQIAVVDGGSDDGTVELVRQQAARFPAIVLLHNPKRLQAAAINLAAKHFRDQADWFIRVDAHAAYPEDYCEVLLDEARRTGAESVTVKMTAKGQGLIQRNIAAAQNAVFGNGGSVHRNGGEGRFVDHGHHALMQMSAFCTVGGYDEGFSHNEDAELDQRLRKAGYRIWLTAATGIAYFPRDTLGKLSRQYLNFGAGRFATALKHPGSLERRHFVLMGLAPVAGLSVFSVITPQAAIPLVMWFALCLVLGLVKALRCRAPDIAFCGIAAAVMQMSWSFGFWREVWRSSWCGLRAALANRWLQEQK
ncbi:glycosyltransferase family 2 protein [Roseinatronobacter bogoriensis]|uniref:Glycosyltransferase family 2 protein n=1 Tax=Roseinatronobacter bogoriensis subsp. barguzinensis TaxID=441209 RepID=A0A2K8K5G6_9RHOB|nr:MULTISPECIES: glycosyltransferase family 2 protein [Rhodobaca]ATX64669.1 glycosyltransferase family 2 protein [Rhodobaca barguzinensis]MBB4209491.1 succinoglycan biosynthesis protein ExoA [Rhodobaca bogoriensis DSM 18756]TDW35143.1 succinoglycan biosynthesis protein ExoA [Rhodobaca barguzinensis]TDY66847.1 succinoglycan biosynthesis protein ExoA [Rhodobaca bogoriensis DSM 18756]